MLAFLITLSAVMLLIALIAVDSDSKESNPLVEAAGKFIFWACAATFLLWAFYTMLSPARY